MKLTQYLLPLAFTLLLISYLLTLPPLHRCTLTKPPLCKGGCPKGGGIVNLPLLLITLTYALAAFHNLGNLTSPQTFVPMNGVTATLTLDSSTPPAKLMLYCGVGSGTYTIEYSADGENFSPAADFEQNHVSVLKWNELPLPPLAGEVAQSAGGVQPPLVRGGGPRSGGGVVTPTLRITCTSGAPYLGEIAAYDADGRQIVLHSDSYLTDEQDMAVSKQSFMNSSYFDEIYHARTAWEHLERIWPYEISHPPLGKLIISLGVLLFGMTPFGWRFSGTLFGVLMLPVMYAFLKRLFKDEKVSILGVIILAADFMHFAQTRIATIDTYAVFFILLMYMYMYDFWEDGSWRSLALSGVFFGLGAASKWTCLYAGAGLALLWLLKWLKAPLCKGRDALRKHAGGMFLAKAGSKLCLRPGPSGCREATEGLSPPCVKGGAPTGRGDCLIAFLKNIPFCILFFVLIPIAIYYLSYLPYGLAEGHSLFSMDYARMVWSNQTFMFTYHSGVDATHPYSSRWYQWLLNIRPILYYLEYFPDGSRSSIAAFLNPVTCWGGLFSLFVLVYTGLFRKDRRAQFILIGFLAQLLPWVFISRLTFEYHYFPSSVFLVLAICYVFNVQRLNRKDWLQCALPVALAAVVLFVLFYPALSGAPVNNAMATKFLKWLPTWPLTALTILP